MENLVDYRANLVGKRTRVRQGTSTNPWKPETHCPWAIFGPDLPGVAYKGSCS